MINSMSGSRMVVVKAYQGSERVLRNSNGEVWTAGKGWVRAVVPTVTVGAPYERWSDVPASWIGGCPYFR